MSHHDPIRFVFETTPAWWRCYFDPEGPSGFGNTRAHALAALIERCDDEHSEQALMGSILAAIEQRSSDARVFDPKDTLRLRWLAETRKLAEDDFGACNWNGTLLGIVMKRFQEARRKPGADVLDAMRAAIDTQVVHEEAKPSTTNKCSSDPNTREAIGTAPASTEVARGLERRNAELLDELTRADAIISAMLNALPFDVKPALIEKLSAAGVTDGNLARAHERRAVIDRAGK